MTKGDVVDAVARKTGMTKKDAGEAVEAVLDVITGALQSGDSVTFTGFGKFSTSRRSSAGSSGFRPAATSSPSGSPPPSVSADRGSVPVSDGPT